jgi:hypothetical protein
MMAAQTGNPWMWDFKARIYGFAVAMAMELSSPAATQQASAELFTCHLQSH